jgi:hypothetical protein
VCAGCVHCTIRRIVPAWLCIKWHATVKSCICL